MTQEQKLANFDSRKYSPGLLLALNLEVINRIEANKTVSAPGVPKNHQGTQQLIADDCIKPIQ